MRVVCESIVDNRSVVGVVDISYLLCLFLSLCDLRRRLAGVVVRFCELFPSCSEFVVLSSAALEAPRRLQTSANAKGARLQGPPNMSLRAPN